MGSPGITHWSTSRAAITVPACPIVCHRTAALDTAGLCYAFDPSKPAGSRLVKALLLKPGNATGEVDPLASYNVVTNDYIAGGGDGYSMIAPEPSILPDGALVAQVGCCCGQDSVAAHMQLGLAATSAATSLECITCLHSGS